MVSDGGEKKYEHHEAGYHGWVIGTKDTEVCNGRGTAHNGPTSSYRSEGYGRLALLRFLYHYMKFHRIDTTLAPILSYCDNESVIGNEDKLVTGEWSWLPIWCT